MLLKIFANISAPVAVNIHARRLILPKPASFDGNRNIPAPIMLPMTNDVVVINPIFCDLELIKIIYEAAKIYCVN